MSYSTILDFSTFMDSLGRIARKCNFRKHLQGHKAYSAGMKLEDHWVCRELPRPKRKEGTSLPSQKSVAAKVERSREISLKLQTHEECYKSIAVPQLHSIGAFFSFNIRSAKVWLTN